MSNRKQILNTFTPGGSFFEDMGVWGFGEWIVKSHPSADLRPRRMPRASAVQVPGAAQIAALREEITEF